ncbi:hypothetical protein BJF79_19670 [Actinomadura sp. CNU-125]|nr:hypothetical protein BJF79_19670 [Actinomadura sp. CNU-125]
MSQAVGTRWFRQAGGVGPCLAPTVSGRYLSFAEREEIALLRAQQVGVREIARPVQAVTSVPPSLFTKHQRCPARAMVP